MQVIKKTNTYSDTLIINKFIFKFSLLRWTKLIKLKKDLKLDYIAKSINGIKASDILPSWDLIGMFNAGTNKFYII